MKNSIRVLAMTGALLLVGGLALVAVAANGNPSPAPVSVVPPTDAPTPEPTATPSPRFENVRGNCDEPEHAQDPECRGEQELEDGAGHDVEDRSGPSESSGPGSVGDDDHDDDSGHGSDDDHDDDSGHGSGED